MFTSSATLDLNAMTGTINPSTSMPGTYTVTYTTPCGIDSAQNVTIIETDDATFTYSAAAYCLSDVAASSPAANVPSGDAGTFTEMTGGLVFADAATGAIDLLNSMSGTYTITFTTSGTCSDLTTQSITLNPLDVATIAYDASIFCQSEPDPSPTITGFAAGSFSSTQPDLIINSGTGVIDLSATIPGTYQVDYTTTGTCPIVASFTVEVRAVLDATFSYPSNMLCLASGAVSSSAIVPSGNAGTFTEASGSVLFVDANTGVIDLENSATGTYTIQYATSGSCPSTATFGITINPEENASFSYGANSYCQNEADPLPTITGNMGGNFTANSPDLTLDAMTGNIDLSTSIAGTYVVTYTTTGPCPASEDFTIDVLPLPSAGFSFGASTVCEGTPTVTATVGSGTAPGLFSTTTGIPIDPNTGVIDLIGVGGGTYDFIYTTSTTCVVSEINALTVIAVTDPFISVVPIFCEGGPTDTLEGLNPGGTWTGLGITNNGVFDPTITGVGTFRVFHTTANGLCFAVDSIDVEVFAAPSVAITTVGASDVCAGDPAPSINVDPTGTGPFSDVVVYLDGGLDSIVPTANGSFLFNNTTLGDYQILSITDNNGCESLNPSNVQSIGELPLPSTPLASFDTTYCEGETLGNLTVTGAGGTFNWYSDPELTNLFAAGSSVSTPNTLGTNTYYVTEFDGACESLADSVAVEIISIPPPPIVQTTVDYCPNEEFLPLVATPVSGGNISWYSDEALTDLIVAGTTLTLPQDLTGTQTYWVIEDAGLCFVPVQVTVNIADNSAIGVTADQTICIGEEAVIEAFGGASYSWELDPSLSDPDIPNPIATPSATTTYVVLISDGVNCAYVDSTTITIDLSADCGVETFNAFSPDGDGVNDTWVIEGVDRFDGNEVHLYNRWGQELVSYTNYDNVSVVWDGTGPDGNPVPVGTYYYVVRFGNGEKEVNGWIYLAR